MSRDRATNAANQRDYRARKKESGICTHTGCWNAAAPGGALCSACKDRLRMKAKARAARA